MLNKNNKSLEWIVQRVKDLNAKILQYRNKTGSFEEKKRDITIIKKLCNIPLVVNDDIELVEYCDGIHLGQEDILHFAKDVKSAVMVVRGIVNYKLFGLSTHNEGEIKEANSLPLDYIGLGAYRKTETKDTVNVLGDSVEYLAGISKKPVAVIGGVRLDDSFKNVAYITVGSNLYEN